MKEFRTYSSIRRRALIFGLPVTLFALQMVVLICSFLIVIFSFGLTTVLGSAVANIGMYTGLLKLTRSPQFFSPKRVLPKSISNQLYTELIYEAD